MQRIRTLAEIALETHILVTDDFLYQNIMEKVVKLKVLGMSFRQISQALGVDDKTVKKAIDFAIRAQRF